MGTQHIEQNLHSLGRVSQHSSVVPRKNKSLVLMGKFDALCFFLILLAAAPHFSRGGCCKRNMGYGKVVEYDSVVQCIQAGGEVEKDDWIIVNVTAGCSFGVRSALLESTKKIHIQGGPGIRVYFRGDVHIGVGELKFTQIDFHAKNGDSTVSIYNSMNLTTYTKIVSGCFLPGVKMLFADFAHVIVERTHFNLDAKGPTMLEIEKGSILFQGDKNIVRCTKNCNNAPIKVNVCGDTTLRHVVLDKGGPPNEFPIFEFSPCEQAMESVPTLKIEGIRLHGEIPTNGAWIQVTGDAVNGPTVNLADNDYHGLANEAKTQIGTVYRFIGALTPGRSNFHVSRNSTEPPPSGWRDEDYLATMQCTANVLTGYTRQTLPIGQRNENVQRYDLCPAYCCYVDSETTARTYDTSIAACASGQEKTVHVVRDCALGENGGQFYVDKIVKADDVKEDRVAITFDEGAYQFVEGYLNNRSIVFENIHFKKAMGAGDGVAKMYLGVDHLSMEPFRITVEMIGCVVDTDVVVKVGYGVHFTATDTTFNQGVKESVLHLIDNANQVVELSECVLADTSCHTMITGPMCGKVTIKDTELRKTSHTPCTNAAIDLKICDKRLVQIPILEIAGVEFKGEVANDGDAAWIKVQVNRYGPEVNLAGDNDYSNLHGSLQVGRVYRFEALVSKSEIDNGTSIAFSITREAGQNMMHANWEAGQELATVVYMENGNISSTKRIFPIGNRSMIKYEVDKVCCNAKRERTMTQYWFYFVYGRSVSDCVERSGSEYNVTVTLLGNCPLGYTNKESLRFFENFVFEKKWESAVITLAEGQERPVSGNIPSSFWEIPIESATSSTSTEPAASSPAIKSTSSSTSTEPAASSPASNGRRLLR